MIDTKRKALNLISKLKKHLNVNHVDVFKNNCSDDFWKYYFNITGFYKGGYFAIQCHCSHIGQPFFEVLDYVTDNLEEFKKEFKL